MADIGIGDFSQGVDTSGVETYLDEIKSVALNDAAAAVEDISGLETACTSNWSGQACTDFLEKLRISKDHLKKQYETLYNNLESEITQIANDMKKFDESLIQIN